MPIRQLRPAAAVVATTLALLAGGVVVPGGPQAFADPGTDRPTARPSLGAPGDALRKAAATRGSRSAGTRINLSNAIASDALILVTLGDILAERDRLARLEKRRERARAAREAAREARQREAYLSRWVMPIHSFTWSAGFGEAGSMWSSGYHTGQDWTTSYGTPVYAAARGWISSAAWSDAYGNKLVITHDDGTQTWYAHLDSFRRTSGHVAAGTLVGYVGCTGNCYGPHLHFEVHPGGGDAVNPVTWLREHRVAV